MGIIKRHRRKLASGEERVYIYEINDDERNRINIIDGSVSPTLYRSAEKNRIVAALQANSSLLVVGEAGCGKSALGKCVATELEDLGFPVVLAVPNSNKQMLKSIATELGVDTEHIEGKAMTTSMLSDAIAEFLSKNTAFLIFDDAHRLSTSMRCWLEKLHSEGVLMLLLASRPPARDIFLKLPRIELQPLTNYQIREIMVEAALEMKVELSNAALAQLQQRCGGNPMLAKRVIREEYLGLDENSPDHTQWIDGTPYVIGGLMVFTIVRFIGLGLNSTSLYLIGGIIAVALGIFRLLVFSLPKKSTRLGR